MSEERPSDAEVVRRFLGRVLSVVTGPESEEQRAASTLLGRLVGAVLVEPPADDAVVSALLGHLIALLARHEDGERLVPPVWDGYGGAPSVQQPSSGGVGPTAALEVKSLGVGTPAPATKGYVVIAASTSTPNTDWPARIFKTRGWVWLTVNEQQTGASNGVVIRPTTGLTNGQVDLGYGVKVYPATGGTYISAVLDTGIIWAGKGYGTRTPKTKLVTLVSGTAKEITATRDMTVYVVIEATVAGSYSVEIMRGAAVHTVCATVAVAVGNDVVLPVHVPMGWSLKVTVTSLVLRSTLLAIG